MATSKTAAPQSASVSSQGIHLIVAHAFGKYRRGDHIKDDAEIQAVLAGPNARCVNKVLAS